MTQSSLKNIVGLLQQADALRFKLLGIVGKDQHKRNKLIDYLKDNGWTLVDIEQELLPIKELVDQTGVENEFELQTKIKEWFNAQPNNLILINAGILYHDLFLKMSPVGAFKYNSRNKNCVLFLEDESRLGNRLYYGQIGSGEYYDQEISDILLVDLADVDDNFESLQKASENQTHTMTPDSIGNFFQFRQIKDVIDIDADLNEHNQRRELVASYILSPSLEKQIVEFYEDLEKPIHKARTIIGNYGSGKSHLVAFLISLIEDSAIVDAVNSSAIQTVVKKINRPFFHVQFELQSGQVELKTWFYGKIRNQLKAKYEIAIPVFDPLKDYDDKENIKRIIEIAKGKDPTAGLLVVIDEVSDFLSTKQKETMKADLQFLRIIGQVCQDQDLMFIGSMQEDVFTSPKFKDVANEIGRVSERFQNIIIHKEDVKKVISTRIVPKTEEQRHKLEAKLALYAAKIPPVSSNLEDYVALFPLTPFLLELFATLPYFEKRGVIQFAMNQIKDLLYEPFPYFITFERIYDLLANDHNKRNLEEIFEISKAMAILEQKVLLLEETNRQDALKICKALAVYSLWDQKDTGATAAELANNLMLLPANQKLTAADHVSLVVRKLRDVTDGEYIKVEKEEGSATTYFRFETKTGVDPEEKITQKAAAVSNSEIEAELFRQLAELVELEKVNGFADVYDDECSWPSVKSFRKGYVVFIKDQSRLPKFEPRDYALAIVSPFAKNFTEKFSERQIVITFQIDGAENVEIFKEIAAIRQLIAANYQTQIMNKKLDGRINGYKHGTMNVTGVRYRIAKLLINYATCYYNGVAQSITRILGRESASVPEIIDAVKTAILDKPFTEQYPDHPVYAQILSGQAISDSCSKVCQDLVNGDFTNLGRNAKFFLEKLNLLNPQGYPDISLSPIALEIMDILKADGAKVTDIQKELVEYFAASHFGLEPEIVEVFLIFLTVQGKVYLQARGGEKWDINNIKEKFRSVNQFENILYVRLSENYSYDFAERLMNTLGLNGARIRIDRERSAAFVEYKKQVATVLRDIQSLEQLLTELRNYSRIHLDLDGVNREFVTITAIAWRGLDIANFTQFASIEHFNSELPKIELRLRSIQNLLDGLTEYRDRLHPAIEYMDNALYLIGKHSLLAVDPKSIDQLTQLRNEVKSICAAFDKFQDKAERNPLKGKTAVFLRIYKYDVYIPAHDKYVGKQVDWNTLDNYPNQPLFIKLNKLFDIKLINGPSQFKAQIVSWMELKKFKCNHASLEQTLDRSAFCQECLFPQKEGYTEIPGKIGGIEQSIAKTYRQVEANLLKLLREYRDNLQYLSETEKKMISRVMEDGKLPPELPAGFVAAVNHLLKEVEVIEVADADLLTTLFPENQVVTLEELRQAFTAFEHRIKDGKDESAIRIKLNKR
jgi:hypothetical protein